MQPAVVRPDPYETGEDETTASASSATGVVEGALTRVQPGTPPAAGGAVMSPSMSPVQLMLSQATGSTGTEPDRDASTANPQRVNTPEAWGTRG